MKLEAIARGLYDVMLPKSFEEAKEGLYLVKTSYLEMKIHVCETYIRLSGVIDLCDYMDQEKSMEYVKDIEDVVDRVSRYVPFLTFEVDDNLRAILLHWDVVPEDTDELLMDVLKLQGAMELAYDYLDTMFEF